MLQFSKSSDTVSDLSFWVQGPDLEFLTSSAGMLLLQPH